MARGFVVILLALLAVVVFDPTPAHAQTNFDRPGGDYQQLAVPSGDPAACALLCERDRRCRAWSFSYPKEGDGADNASCWLKNTVPPRVEAVNSVSGVRGAGVIERRNSAMETSIDRFGGDYRSFAMATDASGEACRAACESDPKCRAWTYARPGYASRSARCFLKSSITPPRRRPGLISGVIR
ncbi:PAN domain-containing protein [Bradyrhizobium sp. LHD-71]|uniref:PAN domain-containing protein n=1 Tax=Bradyrhizobium sp. LHD-71 TaxID=3072141 RepID=UPI00280FCE56|nr:PAN domain-containing protein [Bradyrhizobium sp. LHD-71]MDQ8730375.1 PAN domain-containing protein [Bradyrhizobium sp. LHD-71]